MDSLSLSLCNEMTRRLLTFLRVAKGFCVTRDGPKISSVTRDGAKINHVMWDWTSQRDA